MARRCAGSDQLSAKPTQAENLEHVDGRFAFVTPPELPADVKDLIYAYLRIRSVELRSAALRAVRAIGQP
jgi:hypothetical protein